MSERDVLARFEAHLDPARPEAAPGVSIIGYGEVSTVFALAELPGRVCKRMSGFRDAEAVAGALDASGSDARVLMGVPTYEPFGFMHRRGVETPENALVGVVAGLRGLGAGGTFEGVALYAEWTTDASDWAARTGLKPSSSSSSNHPLALITKTLPIEPDSSPAVTTTRLPGSS